MPSTNQEYLNVRHMTVQQMEQLPNEQLIKYIKQSAYYANKRREKVFKYYEQNPNAVLSPSYKELDKPYKNKKTFDKMKEKEFTSWASYDFDIPKNVDLSKIPNIKNYLVGKLMKNIRFLDNKTSTVYGIKKMLDNFKNRISSKGVKMDSIEKITNDKEMYQELWKLYNTIKEEFSTTVDTNLSSNELQTKIIEILDYPNYEYARAMETLREEENKKYGKKMVENKRDDIIDKFTDLGGVDDGFNTDKL